MTDTMMERIKESFLPEDIFYAIVHKNSEEDLWKLLETCLTESGLDYSILETTING